MTLSLAACAANSTSPIMLAPGATDPDLRQLARRAEAGDKYAQLELGVRYEEGRGLAVDLERAVRLYRMAASDSGGPLYVYTPTVGRNGRGRVLPVRNPIVQRGLAEAQTRLARLVNAQQAPPAGDPPPVAPAPLPFTVEDFFPAELLDGQCNRADSPPVAGYSQMARTGAVEPPVDLDCHPVELPQWPAAEGRDVSFYLTNLRNFLVARPDSFASDSLSSLLQSSGLLSFEQDPYALRSLMALAIARGESWCSLKMAGLSHRRGLYSAMDDWNRLFNKASRSRNGPPCTQPEIAAILARGYPEMRRVAAAEGETPNGFGGSFFPRDVRDGECRVPIGAPPELRELADLDRHFPMSDPPDLDCYRIRNFSWPAPPGHSPWFYLGNLAAYSSYRRGLSNYSVDELLDQSRILDQPPNGYIFFAIARIVAARNEVACAISFYDLADENGVLQARGEVNPILPRMGDPQVTGCQSQRLRSILERHGGGDG